jgi:hypothetical protein
VGVFQCIFKRQPASSSIVRPKLVVGIVVDQMRWDYLYRYYDMYTEGDLKTVETGICL